MSKMSKERVRIVKDDEGRFRWVRYARNHRPTHRSKTTYSKKYTAIVAAVRENEDVYRENFLDYTEEKQRPVTSTVVFRRPTMSS